LGAAELTTEQLKQLSSASSGGLQAGSDFSTMSSFSASPLKPTLSNPSRTPNKVSKSGEDSSAKRDALPKRPVSEYEKQMSMMVGQTIRFFGYDVFEHATGDSADLAMADDYLLGPGDTINVRIWGQLEADLTLTVDQAGKLFIPKVGNVNVAGLPFSRLEGSLRSAVSRVYRNFELAVSSADLKTLSITVVGQVRRPGVFPMSSQGTVINALMAAGGPDAFGSMRGVKLKRRSGETRVIDLYALLLTGDKVEDYRLQAGDVIHVPKAGPRVAIAGGVVRPAIYELVKGVSLAEVLSMASGFSANADTRRFSLDRIQPNMGRVAQEVTVEMLNTLTVTDGDVLQIPVTAQRYESSVSLRGHVSQPRRLAWRDGMRISDVIDSTEMLRTAAFWQRFAGVDPEQ